MRIVLTALVITVGTLSQAACAAQSPGTAPAAESTQITTGDSSSSASTSAATSAPSTTPVEPTTSAAASPAWIQGAIAKIRVDRGEAGGMRGCKGKLTQAAKEHFTKLYSEAAKCGAAKPGLKGQITFHSTLEDGGGLSEFSVFEDKLGAPDVVACIQTVALSLEFPKVDPKTPCVQLVHPLTFP